MLRTAVVALGGNAFTREGQAGTHAEQARNAAAMARAACGLREAGWNVVLVHGNGPQIGNLAIQQEEGAALVPAQPLFCLGAMTQGQLGSLITTALRECHGDIEAAALVTHVIVSPDDPAFGRPSKPIGPFFPQEEAERLARTRGWTVTEDSGRGYRRVVPSPEPKGIVEAATLRTLVERGVVVVAAGGGGIPMVDHGGLLSGVEAVIDKDYAAETLATSLRAEALVLVTGVSYVALDFGTPQQRAVAEMNVEEAERHLADGQFPEGSMGPKVRAATRFLRAGGRTVVITSPERVLDALRDWPGIDGWGGTRIVSTPADVKAASA